MHVSLYRLNSYKPGFLSRNEEIKKADDLQRRARASFPMVSATYAEEYYYTMRPESKYYNRARGIVENMTADIQLQRSLASLMGRDFSNYGPFGFLNRRDYEDDTSFLNNLEWVKGQKVGCCDESAKTALATLCANGYYNSAETYVYYGVQFVNKESGEVEYKNGGKLPHCFVVTDLKKDGEGAGDRKNDIVIDPWLGFADYAPGAVARFKQAFSNDLFEMTEEFKQNFAKKKEKMGEEFNPDDYEIKTTFTFMEWSPKTLRCKQKLGQKVREKYPETILNIKA